MTMHAVVGLNMGTVNEQRAISQVCKFDLHFHGSFTLLIAHV